MWSATPAFRSVLEEFPANFSNLNKGAKCHTYFHCQLRVLSVCSEQACLECTLYKQYRINCLALQWFEVYSGTISIVLYSGATYRSVEVHYWGCPDSEHKKSWIVSIFLEHLVYMVTPLWLPCSGACAWCMECTRKSIEGSLYSAHIINPVITYDS